MEFFLFYLFSSGIIISSWCTVLSLNPVYSVFFLVLAFINSSALLLLIEIEFFAILFLIVYVGAIAVLFLFVVIILDLKKPVINQQPFGVIPISFFFSFLFFFEIFFIIFSDIPSIAFFKLYSPLSYLNWCFILDNLHSVHFFGQVLYTYYVYYFLTAGILLLLAIVSAISLTSSVTKNLDKKQLVFQQLSRSPFKSVFNLKIKKNE